MSRTTQKAKGFLALELDPDAEAEIRLSARPQRVRIHGLEIEFHKSETSILNSKEEYLNAILEIARDYSAPNWNGYAAEAVKAAALEEAIQFSNLLPDQIFTPEIFPMPNGAIAFQWSKHGNTLLLTLSGKKQLVFSTQFANGVRHNGVENFIDQIPSKVSAYFLIFDRFN